MSYQHTTSGALLRRDGRTVIRARYTTTCHACAQPIQVLDPISVGRTGTTHLDCGAPRGAAAPRSAHALAGKGRPRPRGDAEPR